MSVGEKTTLELLLELEGLELEELLVVRASVLLELDWLELLELLLE